MDDGDRGKCTSKILGNEFDAEDVKQNKIYAMLIYLSGVIGIIIALLVSKDSAYIKFHVTQYVRFLIAFTLVSLAIAVLAFTVIIPIIGGVASGTPLEFDFSASQFSAQTNY